MIIDYLDQFDTGTRADFDHMLMDKISDNLTDDQKKNKIRNILQSLKSSRKIDLIKGTKNWKKI